MAIVKYLHRSNQHGDTLSLVVCRSESTLVEDDVPSFGVTVSLLMEKSPSCCASATLLAARTALEEDAMVYRQASRERCPAYAQDG